MITNINKRNKEFSLRIVNLTKLFSTNMNDKGDKYKKRSENLSFHIQRLTKEFNTLFWDKGEKQNSLQDDILIYFMSRVSSTKPESKRAEEIQNIVDKLIQYLSEYQVKAFIEGDNKGDIFKLYKNLINDISLPLSTSNPYNNNKGLENVTLIIKLAKANIKALTFIVLTETLSLEEMTIDREFGLGLERNILSIKLGEKIFIGMLYQFYTDARDTREFKQNGITKYPTEESLLQDYPDLTKDQLRFLLQLCNAPNFKKGMKDKVISNLEKLLIGDWIIHHIFNDVFDFLVDHRSNNTKVIVVVKPKYMKIYEYLIRADTLHLPRFIKPKAPTVDSDKYIEYNPYTNELLDTGVSLFIKSMNNDLGKYSMNNRLTKEQEEKFVNYYIPVVYHYNSIPFKINKEVLDLYEQYPSVIYQDNIWYMYKILRNINNQEGYLESDDIRSEDSIYYKTLESFLIILNNMGITDFREVIDEQIIIWLYFIVANLKSSKPKSNEQLIEDYKQGIGLIDKEKCLKHLSSDLSRYNQIRHTMYIARLASFIDLPFYLPVLLDWRGRIYTINTFLTYQGTDMSKSLLLFNNKQTLNKDSFEASFNTFKIYGANLYGLTQVSYEERCSFINELLDEIIEGTYDFIFKSKEPYVFLAWCKEYRSLYSQIKENKDFIQTDFPVYADASCNGIQHLSLQVKDSITAAKVNLLPKNKADMPTDIYTEVTNNVNKLIINSKELSTKCKGLQLVRSEVKKGVMTIPYGATMYGIAQGVSEKLEDRDIPVQLSKKDAFILARYIKDSVSDPDSPVSQLIDYLTGMTDILSKLRIPVLWKLSQSVTFVQSYKVMNKVTVRTPQKSQYTVYLLDKDKIDKHKQKAAIVPNIVHSADAAVVLNLILKINEYKSSQPIEVVTVLDCFVTTLPYINKVKDLVALATIDLYFGKDDYINSLLELWLWSIEALGYFIVTDEDGNSYVAVNEDGDQNIKLPEVPKSGDLKVEDIIDAIYMIQ